MKIFSHLLIWLMAFSVVPALSYAQEEDEEEYDEEIFCENEPDELKEIFGAIQKDKHINKERIKRIKELLKEKGWLDRSKHS